MEKYLATVKLRPVLLKDGSIYSGTWDKNLNRHGFGTYIQNNGCKYIGMFDRNVISKCGRLIDSNGDYYEGEF